MYKKKIIKYIFNAEIWVFPIYSLEHGLKKTIKFYEENYE